MLGLGAWLQLSAGKQKCQKLRRLQAPVKGQRAECAPAEVIMLQLECENVIFLWLSTLTACATPELPPSRGEPETTGSKTFPP